MSWNFSNPLRVLDLDDRQGLIASSAMQQKKRQIPARSYNFIDTKCPAPRQKKSVTHGRIVDRFGGGGAFLGLPSTCYFALDSAEWWEQILGELLPNAQFPAAVIRRTFAYQMFMAAHIAPSHRRPPHPVWEDALSLIADLLFGSGVDRYVGSMSVAILAQAAVSVQNPPSGSQTCFPGGWVR